MKKYFQTEYEKWITILFIFQSIFAISAGVSLMIEESKHNKYCVTYAMLGTPVTIEDCDVVIDGTR